MIYPVQIEFFIANLFCMLEPETRGDDPFFVKIMSLIDENRVKKVSAFAISTILFKVEQNIADIPLKYKDTLKRLFEELPHRKSNAESIANSLSAMAKLIKKDQLPLSNVKVIAEVLFVKFIEVSRNAPARIITSFLSAIASLTELELFNVTISHAYEIEKLFNDLIRCDNISSQTYGFLLLALAKIFDNSKARLHNLTTSSGHYSAINTLLFLINKHDNEKLFFWQNC